MNSGTYQFKIIYKSAVTGLPEYELTTFSVKFECKITNEICPGTTPVTYQAEPSPQKTSMIFEFDFLPFACLKTFTCTQTPVLPYDFCANSSTENLNSGNPGLQIDFEIDSASGSDNAYSALTQGSYTLPQSFSFVIKVDISD